MTASDPIPAPTLLLAPGIEARINASLANGTIAGGWLITGPPQIGKAQLADAVAMAYLSGANALGQEDGQTRRLVENRGHPDFTILSRQPKEKSDDLRTDIVVDDVRRVIQTLHRTSSTGRRVVIVDLADDLNMQAANALLKILEEPPAGSVMLLLSSAPGRLLATIRSRCRRLSLPPIAGDVLSQWLVRDHGLTDTDAGQIATIAQGRPGRAVTLAAGEGREAIDRAHKILTTAHRKGNIVSELRDVLAVSDDLWSETRHVILDQLSQAIRRVGRGEAPSAPFSNASLGDMLSVYDDILSLSRRADRLHADKLHAGLSFLYEQRALLRNSHVR